MLLLLTCIMCNVLLAIIFKAFARYHVNNHFAIVCNYFVCVLVASVVLQDSAIPLDIFARPWFYHSVLLAFLFIVGFNILALSFQKSGVALTIIIQKMSLVIPSAFAIALYNEPLNLFKALGIASALVAVVLVNWPSKKEQEKFDLKSPVILLPLATFLLSGIIEIILYYVETEGLTAGDGIRFTASSFAMAGIMGLIYALAKTSSKQFSFGKKELIAGIILGIPNFFTIYLLLVLLSQGWQGSILFPSNSIGILILTAILGFVLYKEKLNLLKVFGLAAGVAAIIFISMS